MRSEGPADGVVSNYREFASPPILAGHLLCLWTQTIGGSHGDYAHRVLPDGCIDLVFVNGQPPIIAGPWTRSFIAQLAAGATIVGARWHPGRAHSMLGVPACALLNRTVPLIDVCGSAMARRFARVVEEPDPSARRLAVWQALASRLLDAAPVDDVVSGGIGWLARHPGGRMDQLSDWTGISHRQMQRRFVEAVGYGPKMFQSVLRFQRLLNLAGRAHGFTNLAQVARDAGYADQAHMAREVRRFAASSPAVLLRAPACTLGMSDLFKTAQDQKGYAYS